MNKKTLITPKKIVLSIGAVIFLFVGSILVWASTIRLPDMSTFEARKIANSSKITDRTGEVVLYDIHQSVRRTQIPFDQMGEHIKHAVIAIEDEKFYTHNGIRPTSILRATLTNITTGSFSQGGSTITQQIVKNTLLNSDKNIIRKLKEWVLAIRLDRQMSKDQILTIYLNDAPYGGTIYGIEEASQAFFNKHAKDLTIAEAAYLAAIPNAPTFYSPFGKNREALNARKNLTLKKMLELGYIDKTQYETARAEKVAFNITAANSIKAPHFVFWVLDYLEQKYGSDVMETGGYTIKTTLDYTIQKKAEEAITQFAESNKTKFNASNSALVTIDPKTGQVLAMVGSKNYFDKTIDGAYNVATAKRQPGSSFKPFIYLTAFKEGYTPDTVLFDVPTEFSTKCNADRTPLPGYNQKDCYNPDNFDNKFKGPINLRSALAESRNIPSVKLLYLVGLRDALETAKALGITTLGDEKNYGLSLVLGGGEVTLLDMTSAYGVLANNGTRNEATGILSIVNNKGDLVEEFSDKHTEVYDPEAIKVLNDVLSDQNARIPTFGQSITVPGVAVKTGTTNDDRDAWIIGYTPDIVVGVWSGNNDNTKMRGGSAAVSGPIWKSYMSTLLPTITQTSFEKPLIPATPSKPILRGNWLYNSVHNILHWVEKGNPNGPVPENPYNDPQYRLWEPPVQAWWEANKNRYTINDEDVTPKPIENTTALSIQNLPETFARTSTQRFNIIKNDTTKIITSLDIFINDEYINTLQLPFTFVFSPKEYGFQKGTYTIKATGSTNSGETLSTTKTFTITE